MGGEPWFLERQQSPGPYKGTAQSCTSIGWRGPLAKSQGKGDILAHPAKGWEGGGCRGTPWLPRPTMAQAHYALRPWGWNEPHVPTPSHNPSKWRSPGRPFPSLCWGAQGGTGHPRDTASPTMSLSDGPGAHSVLARWGALCRAGEGDLALSVPRAHGKARGNPQRPLCHACLT